MLATALLTSVLTLSQVPNRPPNIVYIMADDLGYGELGCYGQAKIPTPNIDRLAKEGIRLNRFYVASPVCAPTRCSLLTGMHQGHAEIRGNKEQGGFGPNDREGQFPISESAVTMAEILKRHGYTSAVIGKWALGGATPKEHPLNHGFDHFYGYLCQRRAHNFYPPYLWRDHGVDLLPGNRPYNAHQKIAEPLKTESEYFERFGGGTHSANALRDASTAFIRANKNRPFFLYHAATLPHAALQAPRDQVEKFPRDWDQKPYLGQDGYLPTPRPRATYAAMIALFDDVVGSIVAEIDRHGLASNTLIVVTSDNGATFNGGVDRDFFNSNGGLRAGKMSLYEGGIRVPFVARFPNRIAAGSRSDCLASCWDVLATVCEAAGARPPKTDGVSFWPALLGISVKPRNPLYFEYPEASAMQAVIFGRFKAIKPDLKKSPERIGVYDLDSDRAEKRDLAASRPDLVREALAIVKRELVPNQNFPLPGVDK